MSLSVLFNRQPALVSVPAPIVTGPVTPAPGLFTALANARDPYRLQVSFRTDVITSFQDNEQRIQLRRIPRRRETYLATTLTGPDMARLDAMAMGGQTTQWIVPYWPHGTQITAAAGPGAATILCDTSDRDFVVGGNVVLWAGPGNAESATITTLASGQIGAVLVNAWPKGTFAIPGRLARWANDVAARRIMRSGADAIVSFDLEGLTDPGVATPSSPQVFTAVFPDRFRQEPDDQARRSVVRFDSPTGAFADYARGATPVGRHRLALWMASRADVNALLQWYYGLKGALAAFWLPTFQADFTPTADITAGQTSVTIQEQGYTAYLAGIPARQHLAFHGVDRTIAHRRVVSAVNNGDGTETLALDAAVGLAVPVQGGMVSQLLYVRLAADAFEITWDGPNVAQATLDVVELPREVPGSVVVPAGITGQPRTIVIPGTGTGTVTGSNPGTMTPTPNPGGTTTLTDNPGTPGSDTITVTHGGGTTTAPSPVTDGSVAFPELPAGYTIPTGYVDEFTAPSLVEGIFTPQYVVGVRDASSYTPAGAAAPRKPPASPNSIGEIVFPAGFPSTGIAPGIVWSKDFTSNRWTGLFLSFTVQLSSNWVSHSSGVNKVVIANIDNQPMLVMLAYGANQWVAGVQDIEADPIGGARQLFPNLAAGLVTKGLWQRVGVQAVANTPGQPNGIVRVWLTNYDVNGNPVSGPTKVTEYTNVGWLASGRPTSWNKASWNPIYGGTGGPAVPAQQYMWMDRLAIGGKS